MFTLPKNLVLFLFFFILVIEYLRKTLVWGIGREGERDWFPSERNKVHSTLLDMQASELCPRSLPFALFHLLVPKRHLLQASRPLLHLPYKEEKDQLGPAEVSIMHTT